jgi:hypothetical protein
MQVPCRSEESLVSRAPDCADRMCANSWTDSLVRYGLGLNLTPEEDEEILPIIRRAYKAACLHNDYYSFDKEYAAYRGEEADGPLVNAVWWCVTWHGVDSTKAKEMVKEAAIAFEDEYLHHWHNASARPERTAELDPYFSAVACVVSGDVLWSKRCPRYNPHLHKDLVDPSLGFREQDVNTQAPVEPVL